MSDKLIKDHLFVPFIKTMSQIGEYGCLKYGHVSFEAQAKRGDSQRVLPRQASHVIASHSEAHFREYLNGIKHDYFETSGHQLAAVAFNAMMEYYFYYKELENANKAANETASFEPSDGFKIPGLTDKSSLPDL